MALSLALRWLPSLPAPTLRRVRLRGWGVVVVALAGVVRTRRGEGAPRTTYEPPGARAKYIAPIKIQEEEARHPTNYRHERRILIMYFNLDYSLVLLAL